MAPVRSVRPPQAVRAALVAALLAGCGTSDDRAQARAAVERFQSALQHGEPGAACAQLTPAAAEQLTSQAGEPCARAVGELDVSPAPVAAAEVFVTSAKVDLQGGESAFLEREPAGWKLSAVGCEPQEGKPADQPFRCELEA